MEYTIKSSEQMGAVLRGFRRDKKLTQAGVGAKVGLAQNAVSEIENSPGRTSLARVFKLLAALDLDLAVRPRHASAKRSDW
jgi:HTH-type transcriptional regulator/antitoxin HipB